MVTVSPQSKEVNQGDDFTLTCMSSILGLEFDWDHPNSFSDFPNVEFSQPLQESITVFGAMLSNEGSYTCRIREMREAVIASANATVVIFLRTSALSIQRCIRTDDPLYNTCIDGYIHTYLVTYLQAAYILLCIF